MAMKPVNAIKKITKRIRNFLPFSPAKEGALRDIHKIKLIETIAKTITPTPVLDAMKKTVQTVAQYQFSGNAPLSNAQGSGGGITINFNPKISLVGGEGTDLKGQILEGLRSYSGELLEMINEAQDLKNRRKF